MPRTLCAWHGSSSSVSNGPAPTPAPVRWAHLLVTESGELDLTSADRQVTVDRNTQTMPILNKGNFSEVKIDLPRLAEQLQIAETLSTLDDRITLLRETNAMLEAIAQALFNSWFVDFDPMCANIRRIQR